MGIIQGSVYEIQFQDSYGIIMPRLHMGRGIIIP